MSGSMVIYMIRRHLESRLGEKRRGDQKNRQGDAWRCRKACDTRNSSKSNRATLKDERAISEVIYKKRVIARRHYTANGKMVCASATTLSTLQLVFKHGQRFILNFDFGSGV
jgi:hypothetical protein